MSAIAHTSLRGKGVGYFFRQSSLALRVGLFLFFLLSLSIRFSQRPDPSNAGFFRPTVQAINQGHPFHHVDPQSGAVIPYSETLVDSGLRFCLSLIASLFSILPYLKEYQFKETDVRYVSILIFMLVNLGLISIRLPNFLTILSQFAVWLAIYYIDTSLIWGDSNFRAIDGLIPVVLGIFSLFLITDGSRASKIRAYVVFGLIFGFLPIFRQTALFIAQSSFLGIFLALCFFYVKGEPWRRSLSVKLIEKLAWTTASFAFVRLFVLLICSLIFTHKFSFAPTIQHGSGQPLFCGLGYAENPYNLAWEDDNAFVNHKLIYDRAEKLNKVWADDLGKTFLHIVLEDPLLFFKNAIKKYMQMHSYICNSELNAENDLDISAVIPKKIHFIFYLLSVVFAFCISIYFAVYKHLKKTSIFIFLAMSAIAVVSSAGPLTVFPGYYASFVGFLYALVLIFTPLLIALERGWFFPLDEAVNQNQVRAIKRNVWVFAALFLACIGGYTLYRSHENRHASRSLLLDRDPLERIRKMGYRYGYLFNRLDREEQEKVLASIQKHAFYKKGPQAPDCLFRPECVILDHPKARNFAELHLIAFFSDQRIPPLPKADQGPSNSYILVTRGDRKFPPSSFFYDPDSCVYNRITDANWNGKYTFITLPITDAFMKDSRDICASAWNMIADRSILNAFHHERVGDATFQENFK